jgi:hypothetical protein
MNHLSSRRLASLAVAVCASTGLWAHTSAQAGGDQPQDATTAILAAFDRYDVVGMNAAHSNEKQDELILAVLRA